VRHRAKRISAVVGAAIGSRAVAVAAQIGCDNGEFLRQTRRDLVPRDVRQRIAVQQKKRGTGAALARIDARAAPVDLRVFEAVEQHAIYVRARMRNCRASTPASCNCSMSHTRSITFCAPPLERPPHAAHCRNLSFNSSSVIGLAGLPLPKSATPLT